MSRGRSKSSGCSNAPGSTTVWAVGNAAWKAYHYVADVWRNADPALQGYVTESHTALRRLGA
jgi:hypothetical protein